MNTDLKSPFGATGIADAGARRRVLEGPAALRHLMVTPQGVPGPAGVEQLR